MTRTRRERLAESTQYTQAAEDYRRRDDNRLARETGGYVERLQRALREEGLEIREIVWERWMNDYHKYAPYPSPNRVGCVRCPYPQDHPVHDEGML